MTKLINFHETCLASAFFLYEILTIFNFLLYELNVNIYYWNLAMLLLYMVHIRLNICLLKILTYFPNIFLSRRTIIHILQKKKRGLASPLESNILLVYLLTFCELAKCLTVFSFYWLEDEGSTVLALKDVSS